MENTNVATSGVSVDRILGLQAELNAKDLVINSLNQQVGSLENQTSTLETQIYDLKNKIEEKTPEVRIVTSTKKTNSWGDTYNDSTVEYKNLSSVQDDIRKEVEAKYKKDQDLSEKTIKDLNKKLEASKDDYDLRYNVVLSDYKKATQNHELEYNDKKLKLDKKLSDKDLEIQKIREELEKVKTDKTNEQVAKQREEEITKLKLRIKELEKTVKNFMDMNFFKRFWNSLTNKAVRVAAEKEVIEKQQEIDKIKGTYSNYGNSLQSYYNYLGLRW